MVYPSGNQALHEISLNLAQLHLALSTMNLKEINERSTQLEEWIQTNSHLIPALRKQQPAKVAAILETLRSARRIIQANMAYLHTTPYSPPTKRQNVRMQDGSLFFAGHHPESH